jgi:hypothetical protein
VVRKRSTIRDVAREARVTVAGEPGLRPHPGVPHPVPPGTVQKLRHVGAATAARKVNGQ